MTSPTTRPSGPGRRSVLRGCAAVGAGGPLLGLLSACGGDAGGTDDAGPTADDAGSDAAPAADGLLTEGLEPGEALPFDADSEPAVLVRLANGDYVAYSAVCTHQGCTVRYDGDDGLLRCPCHASAFDPAAGAEPTSGPAQVALAPLEVVAGDDGVRLA